MKRLIDIVVSGFALLVLAVPLLLIMLLLRLTGEGKVWYLQERVGKGGRRFKVYKFATMRENSEKIGTGDITLRNDPRVLPVGRVLRKAKINEIPQIINIFKGDMSLVGWRPLMPKSFGYYPQHVQEKIINLRPGLTGIGSIVFRDEEQIVEEANKEPRLVYIEDIAPYKGELELWYQDHQSLWLDLKIIFVTAWVVLFPSSRIVSRAFKGLPAPQPGSVLGARFRRLSAHAEEGLQQAI